MLPLLWILAILIAIQEYLIVVLICISLMTCDVEHLFICSLAYLFIFGEASVKVLACFIVVLCWYSWVLRVLCTFWLTILYVLWEYFLLVLGLSSHLLESVFSRAEINFIEIQFISLLFMSCSFGIMVLIKPKIIRFSILRILNKIQIRESG